jgi:hypothetical protein
VDIIDYTKKIHAIEVKYQFFKIKDTDGLFYWDIVRHDVFYAIYFELANIKAATPPKQDTVIGKIYNLIKSSFYAIKLSLAINRKSYKYLCISCARYKTTDDKYIDYALNDVLLSIDNEEKLILESNIKYDNSLYHKSYFSTGVLFAYYIDHLKSLLNRKSTSKYLVTNILEQEFGVSVNLDSIIYNLINRFKTELGYYTKLLQKLKPKKVFLVQNGIQKAFFTAASNAGIPVYEMQHGLVSYIHPAYDYPPNINLSHLNSFPSYFLTFSSFWSKNINYPVKYNISIGNTFFVSQAPEENKEYALTVIFVDIYALDLIKLIDCFLQSGFTKKIAIKLHPNQYYEKTHIKAHFAKYPNVDVIYNERDIKGLLMATNAILAVQSTCVYEALDQQVKVILYKIKDYRTHQDVFLNPNVYLIDGHDEIYAYLDNKFNKNDTCYFEKFKTQKFQMILSDEV